MFIPLGDVINRPKGARLGTWVILILNILVYLFELQTQATQGEKGLSRFFFNYGTVPVVVKLPQYRHEILVTEKIPIQEPSGELTYKEEAVFLRTSTPHWFGLITSMFLHASFFHLFGNMLFFWIFGDNVEDMVGTIPFLFFYLTCGFVSAFAHVFLHPQSTLPVVGASGAIAGVMGAYFVLFPWNRVRTFYWFFFFWVGVLEIPAFYYLGIWFFMQFLMSLSTLQADYSQVAYSAHVGGFLTGILLIILLPKRQKVKEFYERIRWR